MKGEQHSVDSQADRYYDYRHNRYYDYRDNKLSVTMIIGILEKIMMRRTVCFRDNNV